MPARKPAALNKRHSTRSERDTRDDAERAMRPRTAISDKPPATLAKSPNAVKVWKRIIGLYKETEATLVTAFDSDLLAKLCLVEAELMELAVLKKQIQREWERHVKILDGMHPKGDELKDYFNALAQANALLQRFQGMDARIDGKRKLGVTIAQSLYLTPRSRAAVAMEERKRAEPKDDMETLLDNA